MTASERIFSRRQLVQSCYQFAVVFFTSLSVKWSDVNADALWTATVQGVVAALLILGGSFVGSQPPPAVRHETDKPSGLGGR